MTVHYYTTIYGVVLYNKDVWNFLHPDKPYENEDVYEVDESLHDHNIMAECGYSDLHLLMIPHDQTRFFECDRDDLVVCGVVLGNTDTHIYVDINKDECDAILNKYPLFENRDRKIFIIADDCDCCT